MLLDLTDEETLALHDLLNTTIGAARYPVSPRIRMLRGTLTKLRLTARVLERRTPVKAEAVGAAAAELDRRELARELQSVPTGGDLNRQVLERHLGLADRQLAQIFPGLPSAQSNLAEMLAA